jgi:hypothetical protein
MSNEVKVPFGRTTGGKLICAETAMRGLACECTCPKCGKPLVACQGEIMRHHFRHHAETSCDGSRETALHQFAKQIILESQILRLPDDQNLGKIVFANGEVRLGKIIPDVLVRFEMEEVAVEIWVAHQTEIEKIEEYANRNMAAVEVDLRPYRNLDGTEAMWRNAILTAADRAWLFPCREQREENHRRRQEKLELLRRVEAEAIESLTQAKYLAGVEDERLQTMKREKALAQIIAEQQRYANEQHLLARQLKEQALRDQQRRQQAEERAETEELIAAHERHLEKLRTPPDLHRLIAAHGSYAAIPPEAWKTFEIETNNHRKAMRNGDYYNELFRFRARWHRAPRQAA